MIFNPADYAPELQSVVEDANYTSTREFLHPAELGQASWQHMFEGFAKSWRGIDKLMIWHGSEGYTKSWSLPGQCGFVKA